MWMIIFRAASLLAIGMGAGTMLSKQDNHYVPATVIKEASTAISPFAIIAAAMLMGATGYFVHTIRKTR